MDSCSPSSLGAGQMLRTRVAALGSRRTIQFFVPSRACLFSCLFALLRTTLVCWEPFEGNGPARLLFSPSFCLSGPKAAAALVPKTIKLASRQRIASQWFPRQVLRSRRPTPRPRGRFRRRLDRSSGEAQDRSPTRGSSVRLPSPRSTTRSLPPRRRVPLRPHRRRRGVEPTQGIFFLG